jgi:Domain of unknown function (DUF4157)
VSIFRPAIAIFTLAALTCCRSLTGSEVAFLDSRVYHPETAVHKVDFGPIRVWGLDWSRFGMIAEARAQLMGELRYHRAIVKGKVIPGPVFIDQAEKLLSTTGSHGLTINNDIYMTSYSVDYSLDPYLLAHEVMHVWQWQNRQYTGYTFIKILSEHLTYCGLHFGCDAVYDYTIKPGKRFLEYRFEQQGKIVQDYVQSGTNDTTLRRLIDQALDTRDLIAQLHVLRMKAR